MKKSLESYVATTRKAALLSGVGLCLTIFGVVAGQTGAQNTNTSDLASFDALPDQQSTAGHKTLSARAVRQIEQLVAEKESRTKAQQKIDSQIVFALRRSRNEAIMNGLESMEIDLHSDSENLVPVDINADVSDTLVKMIVEWGGSIIFQSVKFKTINARVPLSAMEKIAASEDVRFIGPADRARNNGSTNRETGPPRALVFTDPVISQGDTAHKAALARSLYGITGSGVKVGVVSNGVNSLAAKQGAGELPLVTVLSGQSGSGDEGTAMLEIVHDLAPGAQLYFATAATSQTSFAQNILDLRAAGCDIIVDDVGYYREAVFQDGYVAQSVNTVTAAGAYYFSSAGNEGNKDDNTSGVWEGDFSDSGSGTVGSITVAGGTFHNFGGGVNNQLKANNGGAPIGLFWSDAFGVSANDYDLYILDSGLTAVISASTNVQNGTQDPVELSTTSPNAGRQLLIFKKNGAAARALHLNTFRGRLAANTVGQTHGHSAAAAAFSVAATPAAGAFGAWPNPTGPFPGVFNAGNLSETFTSDGPRRMFYNPDGTPVVPGNLLFATNGGALRQKPDITAADGTACGVSGFNPFYGTSAAAPHAAAIAALVKSRIPAITPAQLRTALIASAIDIEAVGVDRDTGAGILMADSALAAAEILIVAAASVSGRVTTPDGRGVRGATVTIVDRTGMARTVTTSSFGYYTFDGLESGASYTIGVSSRQYRFAAKTVDLTDTLTDVDFVGLE